MRFLLSASCCPLPAIRFLLFASSYTNPYRNAKIRRSIGMYAWGAGMRLRLRALGPGTAAALGVALVISAALPSAAQQAVSKVTITVVGIDRSGTQVAVQS